MSRPLRNSRKESYRTTDKVQSVRDDHPYPVPFFIRKGFIKPVNGTVTSPFGLNRVLNGKPKNFHSGIDIAATLGHPVRCPADGIVRLVDLDMFLMGKTLIIDHGLGVTSIFIHLDAITVHTGDLVRQGEIIAHVGKTGRATGPHLHWGVSAGRTPLDPLRLINRQFPDIKMRIKGSRVIQGFEGNSLWHWCKNDARSANTLKDYSHESNDA